ncbi:Uncharacterized conserved protein YdeI, YjbR/CyaY-like superfamily, DUF1801 family [Octadecabacter temperatus]|uniref:Uncharacterized protein n=1 Tax=Octadecabacter temperatus TaxID=1458307 RepID=A0A0K0Y7Y5_9RHOB|nr:YdeI/OmpD-associated family protein [Octadecabacter temperatus]AKS47025.1 hypothetical protein OSB_24900 [Octadecabacter temperatus]SIO25409.1 Uncharacterized conserved protein YdeI, YjbR/CyaY-like superfamily, DUF1801 family [Octadecabacter temperatus]
MSDVVFFTNQLEFSGWIEGHPEASEIWVGYNRKSTNRASLTWSDSVDVALWFGWIDGVRKSIDDQSYKIRFTPRKLNNVWSAVNVTKVQGFIPLGLMKPERLHVYNNRSDVKGYTSADRNIPLSDAFEARVRANDAAWQFLNNLAPSYRRDSIWWVMSAKKEETRLRRLEVLISSSEEGLKIPSMRKK